MSYGTRVRSQLSSLQLGDSVTDSVILWLNLPRASYLTGMLHRLETKHVKPVLTQSSCSCSVFSKGYICSTSISARNIDRWKFLKFSVWSIQFILNLTIKYEQFHYALIPSSLLQNTHRNTLAKLTSLAQLTSSEITKMRNVSEFKRAQEEIPTIVIFKTLL